MQKGDDNASLASKSAEDQRCSTSRVERVGADEIGDVSMHRESAEDKNRLRAPIGVVRRIERQDADAQSRTTVSLDGT